MPTFDQIIRSTTREARRITAPLFPAATPRPMQRRAKLDVDSRIRREADAVRLESRTLDDNIQELTYRPTLHV